MVVIEALLQREGLSRDKDGRVNEYNKILAPKRTILERDITQSEVDDLVLEITSIQPGQQILIPVIIPSKIHWVTLQIRSYVDGTLHLRVYDSRGARYKAETNNLRSLLKAQLLTKIITAEEATTPIIQRDDVYCGGYAARLISNLALSTRPVYTHINIWSCRNLKDQALRDEDLSIVNTAKPFNHEKFGHLDELSAAECKSNAQEESRARGVVLEDKKTQIKQAISALDQEQRAALKVTLGSALAAFREPQSRSDDQAKALFAILRAYRLDHTILKKFIFKLDEHGELIRSDAQGKIVLPEQDGDANIQDDLEIEQIGPVWKKTQKC